MKNNTSKQSKKNSTVTKRKIIASGRKKFWRRNKIIIPVVVAIIFGCIGVWKLATSQATVDRGKVAYVSGEEGCWLAGRVWNTNTGACTNNCRVSTSQYATLKGTDGSTRGYCTGAVATSMFNNDDPTQCNNLGRRYINQLGCSRRIDQETAQVLGARQCRYSNNIYFAASSTDFCALSCPSGLIKAVSTCPTSAKLAVVSIDTSSRDAVNYEYQNLWAKNLDVLSGWTGSVTGCNAGNISSAARNASVNAVNLTRGLNGLGAITSASATGDAQANVQKAALMQQVNYGTWTGKYDSAGNKINYSLSHSPPATWICYTAEGAKASGVSNLGLAFPDIKPVKSIQSLMDDRGSSNVAAGHRRWLLNPETSQMAFGYTKTASAVQVIGLGTNNTANPTWVSWPSKGYFPDTLEPGGRWSLSAGNKNMSFANATVTVTHGGVSVPVTRYAPHSGYARPTLVWQMPADFVKTGSYTVSVKNIALSGSTTVYSANYTVTFFTPTPL